MNAGAVIVCAGGSRRLGNIDKTVFELGGSPLFYHSFKTFAAIKEIKEIVLVLRKKHIRQAKKLIFDKHKTRKVLFVEGGKERQHSVFNGLGALTPKIDTVLIHDGARPFVTAKVIRRLLNKLRESGAVICAVKVPDTLKQVEAGFVTKTLDRNNLFLVQTPQGFKKKLIMDAYKKLGDKKVSDDACILESIGRKVKVVEGDRVNIKITYPQDIVLAKAIYRKGKFN